MIFLRALPLLFFLIIPWFSYAQVTGATKWKVIDSMSKPPVIRAHPFKPVSLSQNKKMHSNCHSILIPIHAAKAIDIAAILKEKITALLSECGTILVDNRTNALWLQGSDDKLAIIRPLIKQLDKPIKQVLIEARIVNMTKNSADELGIHFGTSPSKNESLRNIKQSAIPLQERFNLDLSDISLATLSSPSMGIAFATLKGSRLLDLELSALESEGHAEIMASPRLVTLDQHAAVIESGEDIPYQQSTLSGATAVAFKKAVLSLKVTPHVMANEQLVMDLQINQDADSGERVQGVPIILTKSIVTRVLVKQGETLILGGIYKQDKSNAAIKVPILGMLPLIGFLFRKTDVKIKNEELLIFITPRIITSDSQWATP